MMCISLFSYGRPVVVRCKGVRLGMGWVGSVIWWVALGWVDENRPTDNSGIQYCIGNGQTDRQAPHFNRVLKVLRPMPMPIRFDLKRPNLVQ